MRQDPLDDFVRTAAPAPEIDPARIERLSAQVFARIDAGEAAAPPRFRFAAWLAQLIATPDAWRYAAPMVAAAAIGGVLGRRLAEAPGGRAIELSLAQNLPDLDAAHSVLMYAFTTTWF